MIRLAKLYVPLNFRQTTPQISKATKNKAFRGISITQKP